MQVNKLLRAPDPPTALSACMQTALPMGARGTIIYIYIYISIGSCTHERRDAVQISQRACVFCTLAIAAPSLPSPCNSAAMKLTPQWLLVRKELQLVQAHTLELPHSPLRVSSMAAAALLERTWHQQKQLQKSESAKPER